jgi:hypothetical protein
MRLLVLALVLGAAGYGTYRYFCQRPPDKRVCARLTELCGGKEHATRCERDVADLRHRSSSETIAKLDSCLARATSCAEGGGCIVGTGVHALGDLFKQFEKGVSDALH